MRESKLTKGARKFLGHYYKISLAFLMKNALVYMFPHIQSEAQ